MGADMWSKRWPFRFLGKRWSRTFLITFLGVILIVTLLDWLLEDFRYIRVLDRLVIAGFILFWLLLYWFRREFFDR